MQLLTMIVSSNVIENSFVFIIRILFINALLSFVKCNYKGNLILSQNSIRKKMKYNYLNRNEIKEPEVVFGIIDNIISSIHSNNESPKTTEPQS